MHHRFAETRINSCTNCSALHKKTVKIGPVAFELIGGESENSAATLPKFDDRRPFGTLAF